jgi:FAD/FMN-containing dehydrogenase
MSTSRTRGDVPLSDFGYYHFALEPYERLAPASAEEVAAVVREARARGERIAVRGGSHSLHGGSVPRAGSISLSTERLRSFRVASEGSIAVGGGAALWDVHDLLARWGGRLPIVNNGSTGPTVGGFVAAGGLGADADRFGGFWNHVRALTLVTGVGEIVRITRDDESFAWQFGALGQLGLVVEAELDVVPWDAHQRPDRRFEGSTSGMERELSALPADLVRPPRPGVLELPVGESGEVPVLHRMDAPRYEPVSESNTTELTYWVTLMVALDREQEAVRALEELRAKHAASIAFLPLFRYFMIHRGFLAPLVAPGPFDFSALFLWGKVPIGTPRGRSAVEALARDFAALVLDRGFACYHQTEWVSPEMDLRRYYGDDVWAHVGALRRRFDPDGVLAGGHAPVLGA